MATAIKCPQCGGGDPKKISDTEYECVYCETLYFIDRPQNRQQPQNHSAQQLQQHSVDHSRRTTRMVFTIIISVLIAVFGFIFYMAQQSMNSYNNAMENIQQQFQTIDTLSE